MPKKIKETIDYSIFEKVDIRLGRIESVKLASNMPKKSYKFVIDFGKFGKRVSIGRYANHSVDDLKGRQVLAVLNFEPKQIGEEVSECLLLGVQYPKVESGEATPLTVLKEAKIGSKVF